LTVTQTVGFYCPTCNAKYVQYVCDLGLPCGHDPKRAIHVYAKHYSSSGEETVEMIEEKKE
jgi:hypothetical protein